MIIRGGHRLFVPNGCSLTSTSVNIAKFQHYIIEEKRISKKENMFEASFSMEETNISRWSTTLQKKIAKEMGKYGQFSIFFGYILIFIRPD
jgi:hypothetical protein